ncbi:MerR family transcriptional regulator [Tengunoibacter tsumagoiensis]|uniref:MerR family transcriptional regulator n=1 Tax=Tengunoibacter tsumagoiensis TaxID=2014871 RepID=A0A402A301_9CHLR|nr:MerR family transcriptional regulator [Tengunoibacter tsumagoiensis]
MQNVLKIGEFAQVSQVSIATLRHYEKLGLFKPAVLDPDTGYRYYALDQMSYLNRILVLKELGFSLEQIAYLIKEGISLERMRGMFQLRQAQIQQMIETEQARLTRIAAHLYHIEQEGKMPTYEIVPKNVDQLFVASLRATVPVVGGIDHSFRKIEAYLRSHTIFPASPSLLLLYSRSVEREEGLYIDVEAAIPISNSPPDNEQITVRTLAGGLMASTIHTGQDLFLGMAHASLYRWINDNGYRIVAPPRQIRLRHEEGLDPAEYITEVQFPIAGK